MPNFKLELTKILKSKKMVVVLLLCVLLPTFLLYWNQTNSDRYGVNLFSKMNSVHIEILNTRTAYRERMKEVELTPEEIDFHMTPFNEMLEEVEVFNQMRGYQYRYEIPEQIVAFYQSYQDYAEHRAIHANGRQFFYIHEPYVLG